MSLILSGTDGLSDVDGSAATPAIRGTDANTGIFFPAADQVAITTGGTQRAVVDASGNVGIGTSSPSSRLDVRTSAAEIGRFSSSATNGGYQVFFPDNVATPVYVGSQKAILSTGNATDFAIVGTGANNMVFGTNAAERMRIDSSGNVGIGTSSPAVKLDVAATTAVVQMDSSSGTAGAAVNRYKASNRTWVTGVNATDNAGAYTIYDVTASLERMRIDSSGILLLGTTSPIVGNERFAISQPTAVAWAQAIQLANTANGTLYTNTSGTAAYTAVSFRNNGTTFSACGAITVSGTTTAYATSSDYRLKENVQPMTGALAKLAQLNPVTYNWKSTGETSEGFIAHELQAVVPECVVGEKDAVDAEGNPVYQGIDTSFLVATLTAAIQEMKAIIDTQASTITQLQADVAALKAQP